MTSETLGPRGTDAALERRRMEAVNTRGRVRMSNNVSPSLRDALAAHDGLPAGGGAPELKPFQVGLCLLAAGRPLDAAEVLEDYAGRLANAPNTTVYGALALACRGAYQEADHLLEAFSVSNAEHRLVAPREASADMLRFSPLAFAGPDPDPVEIDWLVPPSRGNRGSSVTLMSVDWAYFQRLAPLIAENSRQTGSAQLHVHFVAPEDPEVAADFSRRFDLLASMQPAGSSKDAGEASALLTVHRFDIAHSLLASGQFDRVTILDADAILLPGYKHINALLDPSLTGVVDYVGNRPWFRFAAGMSSFCSEPHSLRFLTSIIKYINFIQEIRPLRWRIDQCAFYATWFHHLLGSSDGPEIRNLIPELPHLIHFIEKRDRTDFWERASRSGSDWNEAGRSVLQSYAQRLGLHAEADVLRASET